MLFLSFSSYNLQSQITREVERARNEELRLDRKIDDEIARAKSEEKRIETKLDKEIDRSTQEDEDIHDELDGIKEELEASKPETDPGGSGGTTVVILGGIKLQWGFVPYSQIGDHHDSVISIPFISAFTKSVAYVGGSLQLTSTSAANEINYMIYKNDLNSFNFYGDGDTYWNASGIHWFALGE